MDNIEAARARKKTAAAWERNRTTIEGLYNTKHLEGDGSLMQLMERDHSFKARYVILLSNQLCAKHDASKS
jgi:hypothetical protein